MRLKELFKDIIVEELPSSFHEKDIKSLSCDSREVEKGSVFFAIKGVDCDGNNFIDDAIAKGAMVVAKEDGKGNLFYQNKEILFINVKDVKGFLAQCSQKFYGNPSSDIKTIGITGTNGKTTVSYLLEFIFEDCKKTCGIVGTINHRIGKEVFLSKNTTPGIIDNQKYLSCFARHGAEYCCMEVSSHALDQGRINGIDFRIGIFTNLTQDHLDYHNNMDDYFAAKAQLFEGLSKESVAIINVDDPYGKKLLGLTKAKCITYGIDSKADVSVSGLGLSLSGTTFNVNSPSGSVAIETKLIGAHNVNNILAAVAACLEEQIPLEIIAQSIKRFKGIPGRLEAVSSDTNSFQIFLDYAHTDDALRNVLESLRNTSDSKIILVFGCGGDRDKSKRAKMGKVASELADYSVVTSDNSRFEETQDIVDQIVEGLKTDCYEVILDRREAIHQALSLAKPGDIVLCAGKGHEDYQILKGEKKPFNERDIIEKWLREHV